MWEIIKKIVLLAIISGDIYCIIRLILEWTAYYKEKELLMANFKCKRVKKWIIIVTITNFSILLGLIFLLF